jgi:Zn-dependent protease with chaperone function
MKPNLLSFAAAVFLLAGNAHAQNAERDMQKEAAIWEQLRLEAPNLLPAFKEATTKMDAGDYGGAITLYQQVVDGAPKFDPAVRRLGMSQVASGQVAIGVAVLEKALEMNRSPENLSSLAHALAYPSGKEGSPEALKRALPLIREAIQNDSQADESDLTLRAQLAANLEDEREFREGTADLQRRFPDSAVAHYFGAIVARFDEDWNTAEREIRRAGELGLDSQVVDRFLESGVQTRATGWRFAGYSLRLVAVWVAGLILLFILGRSLSAVTLRSIERSTDSSAVVTDKELAIRRAYKRLIDVAGLYYYVSLPIVMFLVIAVAGSIVYAFLMAGRIPIQLTLALIVGVCVTIFQMVRSLTIKVEPEDPGRALKRDEAPALWKLADDVANDVGTRAIEEIRITPGTELAVYERGTRQEKANDKATRILILGTGVLNDFRTNAFRAVLAHEYGHFAHRDTAGGDVALRVNKDMMNFAYAMAMAGQAVWWNVAFQFLRLYHFIFRRISHGASRLQEALADRIAALKYGADSFEEGLRHVVRRSIEFQYAAGQEINAAVNAGRALHNLYDLTVEQSSSIDEEVKNSINRPTSEDDTHPSPADRFRLLRNISRKESSSDESMVWDYFVSRDALTHEMSSLIDRSLSREVDS